MLVNLHLRSFLLLLLGGLLAATQALPARATPAAPTTIEGLVKVDSKKLAAVYLLPDADFRGYTKVMIDPVQVSLHKDWMKNMNRARGPSRRIDDKDAQEIADAMRSGVGEIFVAAFKAKGYDIVTDPAPDVLRLSPAVINLYINAPDPTPVGRSRTYTVDAGEATLTLQARDSTTGALLGLAVDRRATRTSGRLNYTTSVSNRSDFEALFKRWADISVRGLDELKSRPLLQSPQSETKQ